MNTMGLTGNGNHITVEPIRDFAKPIVPLVFVREGHLTTKKTIVFLCERKIHQPETASIPKTEKVLTPPPFHASTNLIEIE
jgi:hypothetical protein